MFLKEVKYYLYAQFFFLIFHYILSCDIFIILNTIYSQLYYITQFCQENYIELLEAHISFLLLSLGYSYRTGQIIQFSSNIKCLKFKLFILLYIVLYSIMRAYRTATDSVNSVNSCLQFSSNLLSSNFFRPIHFVQSY